MVETAFVEKRIILTRDTHILERRIIADGRVKAMLIHSDRINYQARQVLESFDLLNQAKPFTLCLECNRLLERKTREEIKDRVIHEVVFPELLDKDTKIHINETGRFEPLPV